MTQTITRKSFVAGLGMAAASAGLGAVASSARAAEVPEQWDRETDVLVIGFGTAGTVTACEASDAGDEVLIVEKAPKEEAGGSSRVSGAFFTINEGYEEVENAYRYWRGIYDKDLVENKLNSWPLRQEWLEANPIEGLEEYGDGLQETPDGDEILQYFHPSGGWQVYPSLEAAVESRPIEVLYEAPATALVRDPETGEVLGAIVEQNGAPLAIKARKGVALTTGSYSANAEMMKQYNHAGIFLASYDSPYNTGDGINLVNAIGGQVWGFAGESLEFQDWAIKVPSEEFGVGIRYMKPSGDHTAHIMVNKDGKRFMNEMLNTRHNHEQLAVFDWDQNVNEYVNSPFWMVFDADLMDNGRIGAYGTEPEIDPAYGTELLISWNGVYKTYGWSMDNSAELACGWIVKGDTLEELAAAMHATNWFGDDVTVDAEGLKAQVEAYNAACEAGEDAAFGRAAATLKPLSTPPFYAVELCPGVMYANAGPRVDIENRVLDVAGNPIPRLYAAGQGCFTFFGKSGNPNAVIGGVQCGRSLSSLEPLA